MCIDDLFAEEWVFWLSIDIDYYGFLTVSFEQLWFIPEVHQVKHLRSAAYLGGGGGCPGGASEPVPYFILKS